MIEQASKLNATLTHVFTYQKLGKLIEQAYGVKVDILNDGFIPDELVGHYTYHEWTVDGESELFDIDDDKIVAKWIATGQMKRLDMSDVEGYHARTADVGLEHIMHRLFLDGHIPAGNYLMKVDW